MDEQGGRLGGKSLLDVIVGVEAGVLGGGLMLTWLMVTAPLTGEPWWLPANLFSSPLYVHPDRLGPGFPTVAGAAAHLFTSGLVGALNGLTTPGGRLFGLLIAGAWYLFCYLVVWKRIAPLLLHSSQALLIVGYFLFGSALGQHGHLLARARE